MPTWWNSVESVGRVNTWVLACAAVLGFFAALCVVASWFTGTRLSALQDTELSRFKTQAGVQISAANKSAAEANEKAQASQAASDAAKVKQLEIERQNQELQLKVEQEKRARVEIQKRLADRHVSLQQSEKIKQSLSELRGQKLTLTVERSTTEVAVFSQELEQTFAAAGFDVSVTVAGSLIGGPLEPLSIMFGKNKEKEANAIGLALIQAGVLDAPLPAHTNRDPNRLEIVIKPK